MIEFYEQCIKRAYGKLELNVRELKCQKVYERLKSSGKAQAEKIRDGIKKSFKISSEATFSYQTISRRRFFNRVSLVYSIGV